MKEGRDHSNLGSNGITAQFLCEHTAEGLGQNEKCSLQCSVERNLLAFMKSVVNILYLILLANLFVSILKHMNMSKTDSITR